MDKLILKEHVFEQLRNYGRSNSNQEVCGILTGVKKEDHWVAGRFIPVDNIDEATNYQHYKMEPNQLLDALLETTHANEDADEDFVGIFHTHPNNQPRPSVFDIEGAGYNVFYVIYSPKHDNWTNSFCHKIKKPWKTKTLLIR